MQKIIINEIDPNEVDGTVNYIERYVIEVTENERDYIYENLKSIIQASEIYLFSEMKPFEKYLWLDLDFSADDPRSDDDSDYNVSVERMKEILTDLLIEWKEKKEKKN